MKTDVDRSRPPYVLAAILANNRTALCQMGRRGSERRVEASRRQKCLVSERSAQETSPTARIADIAVRQAAERVAGIEALVAEQTRMRELYPRMDPSVEVFDDF